MVDIQESIIFRIVHIIQLTDENHRLIENVN